MPRQSFRILIAARRDELHLTYEQVAQALGLDIATLLPRFEDGTKQCPIDLLPGLAEVLQIDLKRLTLSYLDSHYPKIAIAIDNNKDTDWSDK